MSAAGDVAAYLEQEGVIGGSSGVFVREGGLSDDNPDPVVAVQSDGGPAPEFSSAEGKGEGAQQDLAVLISVRGAQDSYAATETLADSIYATLLDLNGPTLNGTRYTRVRWRTPQPVFVQHDDKRRPLFTMSCLLMRSVRE